MAFVGKSGAAIGKTNDGSASFTGIGHVGQNAGTSGMATGGTGTCTSFTCTCPAADKHLRRDNIGRGAQSLGNICDSDGQNDSAYHTRSENACSFASGSGQNTKISLTGTNSEHFTKEYVQELSKENSSLRSRLKGVNILSTLLSEAREEISNLNTQKNKMEIAVENLQSRLHRLGADTSVDLAEHEIFMPGHDKQFLNSLISENMRLQKALKSGVKDSSAVVKDEQQTERIKKLEKIIQQLTEQRREKERTLQDMHDSLKASGAEKDKEIALLRERVTKSSQARENAEAICESLSEQTESLREQVKAAGKGSEDVTSQVQKQTQDDRQKENEKIEQEILKMKRATSNLKPEEQVRILEQQVDQLEKENARLTDQLKEVIGMNTRWQRYNDQREAYVIKLSKTSYQQQSKITVLEQRCSDTNKENTELKKMNDMLKRQEENNRDAALFTADQQLMQKDEEIVELKAQLKDMRDLVQKLGSQHPADIDDKEKIQMLQHQVTTFASDFKEERRDRERLQTRYTSALKELREKDQYIQQQLHGAPRFSGRISPVIPYNPQTSCRQELIARGTSNRHFYGEDMPDLPRDVEIDCDGGHDVTDGIPDVPRDDDDDYVGVGNAEGRDDGDDPLQCPHCFRGFSVAEVEKFMQHTTSCLES